MTVEKCHSCGAAIIWCKTNKGKAMPIDAESVPDGNLHLVGTMAQVVKPGETLPGIPLYKSHFASCPNAQSHRKPQ